MTTNKFNLIFRLFCLLILLICTSSGQQPISFKSFEEAKREALSTHKLIFVTFQLDAAETHNRIRSETALEKFRGMHYGVIKGIPCMNFIPPISLTQNFVFCLVPYDAEPYLRKKYYSDDKTALVFDAFSNELYTEVCQGRDNLIPLLQSLPEDASNYYSLLQNLQDHPDSINLILGMADLCQLYRTTTASRKYYDEIVQSKTYGKDSNLFDHVQSHIALNAFLDNDFDKAADLFSDHIKDYPHSSERPMQLFLLTKIKLIKKDKGEAEKYFQILKNEFPDNQHTKWAKDLLDQYKE